MQSKFIIATALILLFALVSSKWTWVEEHQVLGATGLQAVAADRVDTLQAVEADRVVLSYEDAEVLQQEGSLSSNHQEALDADALLKALIQRLTQQVADDAAATNQRIQDRTNSIKKFDDAVAAAKAFLDDLTNQQTALNRKLDEAKTALATRQGERTAEQASIQKENAEQKARLGERIAAIEKQIALIKQILILLSGEPLNPQLPADSIILDTAGEQAAAALFTNTKFAGKKFQRIFIASQNNYEAAKYFNTCKGKANLFTIIKGTNGNIFGGFSTVPMDGSWTWKVDSDAFIFSYKRGSETKMVKMLPTPNNDNRVSYLGHVSFGPVLGADDLFTPDRCNSNTGISILGRAFQNPEGKVVGPEQVVYSSYITGAQNWNCADYEVYQLV